MEPNRDEEESGRDAEYLQGGDDQTAQPWGGGSYGKQPAEVPPEPVQRPSGFAHQENFYDYQRGDNDAELPEGIEAGYNPDLYTQDSDYRKQTGAGSDPTGGYGGTGDALAGMYVKKDTIPKTEGLTIKEGLSGLQAEPRSSQTGKIVALVFFLIIGGAIAAIFTVKRTYIDGNLREVKASLPQWILVQIRMEPGLREFQALTEDERAYLVTRSRIFDLYPALFDYLRATGTFPGRMVDMQEEGVIGERLARDGWGGYFRIDTGLDEVTLVSAGPDHSFRTPDDIRYRGDDYRAPTRFEDVDSILFVEAGE